MRGQIDGGELSSADVKKKKSENDELNQTDGPTVDRPGWKRAEKKKPGQHIK